MDVGTAIGIVLSIVSVGVASDANRRSRRAEARETGSADLDVRVDEYPSDSPRSAWTSIAQDLVVHNKGPGDISSMEITGSFPLPPYRDRDVLFLVDPWNHSGFIRRGDIVRFGCLMVEKVRGEWEPDGVSFPLNVEISWIDGGGQKHQTFELVAPNLTDRGSIDG